MWGCSVWFLHVAGPVSRGVVYVQQGLGLRTGSLFPKEGIVILFQECPRSCPCSLLVVTNTNPLCAMNCVLLPIYGFFTAQESTIEACDVHYNFMRSSRFEVFIDTYRRVPWSRL